MADKSFEQRVKEELGSLKMRPDEAVWTRVEAGLHKEKKRRWLIWFFLFAGIAGASVLGYMVYNEGTNGKEKRGQETRGQETRRQETRGQETRGQETRRQETRRQETRGQETRRQEARRQETRRQETRRQETRRQETRGQEISEQEKSRQETNKQEIIKEEPAKQIEKNETGKGNSAQNGTLSRDSRVRLVDGRNRREGFGRDVTKIAAKSKRLQTFTNGSPAEQPASSKAGVQIDQVLNGNTSDQQKQAANTNVAQAAVPASKQEIEQKEITALPVTEAAKVDVTETMLPTKEKVASPVLLPGDSASSFSAATVPKKAAKKKWEFSVAVNGGNSGLRNYLIPFFTTKAANGAVLNNITPPTNTPSNAIVYPPPAIKDAFGFSAQFRASTPIGESWHFGFSGGYTLLQTSTTIGRRVDSITFMSSNGFNSVGAYFVNSDSLSYTNHYHYLNLGAELSASFSLFRIFKTKWQIGGGMNFLVGSNGLHYDAAFSRSYKNNTLLSATLPYLSTGFDFGIGKNPLVYVGPHWQYNLGHLDKATTAGQHFLFTSVQLSFILPKNKK